MSHRVTDKTKAARGTFRQDRVSVVGRLPRVSELPCPDTLGAEGRRCWERTTAAMAERGYLSPVFAIELEGMCFWYERFHGLRKRMKGPGDTDKNLSIRVAEASRELCARTAKLGLNPVDAARVAALPTEDDRDDELARLLGVDPYRAN